MATATASRSKSSKSNGAASASDVETSLAQVKEDIAALSETLTNYGKGKVGSAKSAANAKQDEILKTSEQALSELSAQVDQLTRQLSGRVREKPVQSLAIAAGIGALLALVARR